MSKPCRRFSAHVPMRRVVDGDARAKIQNLQLWGPLVHLGESRRNSNQLATTTEPVEPERVAGFSAFHSTSYFFVRNGIRNQRSEVQILSGAPQPFSFQPENSLNYRLLF